MASPSISQARAELRESDLRARDPEAYRQRAFELSVAGYFADPANSRALTPFRITDRTYREVWRDLGDYDIRDRLASVKLDAVVLHGRQDPIPLKASQETAALLGAGLTVLEDCGHVPYVEDPAGFHAALDGFLPRVS